MTSIPAVLSQNAEESAFLWLLRRAAVSAPNYSLSDLTKLDGRAEAQLDGLRVAGEDGRQMCKEELEAKEEGEVFAAGVLACESFDPVLLAKVLAVVEEAPKLAGGLISALGWPPFEKVQSHIQTLHQNINPFHQLIGIGASAVHRRHPGQFLLQAVRSQDVRLKCRALKAIGELGDANLKTNVESALHDTDAECRFAAAWSGALLGISTVVPLLREVAESGSPHARSAANLAARRMDLAAAATWQKRLTGNPKHLRLAILVAGASGDPASVPWLISLMGQLPLARLAGESFTMIAGVDLAYRDLERKPPEDFSAGPTEDPKDENVEMDPDDNLPWPEPALVQKWWDKNGGQFQNGTRYLLGKPMAVDWLKTVLRDGRQRQRAAAALELAIRQPGQILFNVAAPGFRQQQILGKGEVIR
jgi:uncharacterized protein (TIGR02270 family)